MSATTTPHDLAIRTARAEVKAARAAETAAWAAASAANLALRVALDAVLPDLPWDSNRSGVESPYWKRHYEREAILARDVQRQEETAAKAVALGIDRALVDTHIATHVAGYAARTRKGAALIALGSAQAAKAGAEPEYEGTPFGVIAQAPNGEWLIGKTKTDNDYEWASLRERNGEWYLVSCHRRRELVKDGCLAAKLKHTRPLGS